MAEFADSSDFAVFYACVDSIESLLSQRESLRLVDVTNSIAAALCIRRIVYDFGGPCLNDIGIRGTRPLEKGMKEC